MTAALVAFLRAQFDEDDAVARAADAELSTVFTRIATFDPEMAADERHIMRHRPARAHYEVVAKRLMLDEALASRHHVSADQYETCPRATMADGLDARQQAALNALNDEHRQEDGREPACWDSCGRDARVRRTLELLALPYVDHPDYMQALSADQA
ncbi:DUF6221 family protein [Streptomyces sp. B1I3]|uniref:DUF6221 family protein n=1 Tax=Streptomyces sp. B1I3 TaxID=3042264 RepID=UPI00278953B6|nr:DUF6221 family protein [Streptomyces sp. B1I3]MDQ0791999.1 hypothetical protein [Streptomyces sp. B1I3]